MTRRLNAEQSPPEEFAPAASPETQERIGAALIELDIAQMRAELIGARERIEELEQELSDWKLRFEHREDRALEQLVTLRETVRATQARAIELEQSVAIGLRTLREVQRQDTLSATASERQIARQLWTDAIRILDDSLREAKDPRIVSLRNALAGSDARKGGE